MIEPLICLFFVFAGTVQVHDARPLWTLPFRNTFRALPEILADQATTVLTLILVAVTLTTIEAVKRLPA